MRGSIEGLQDNFTRSGNSFVLSQGESEDFLLELIFGGAGEMEVMKVCTSVEGGRHRVYALAL